MKINIAAAAFRYFDEQEATANGSNAKLSCGQGHKVK